MTGKRGRGVPDVENTMSRASFVRALPIDMPSEEVLERAHLAGIDLLPSDVHSARWYMRNRTGGKQQPESSDLRVAAQIPSFGRNQPKVPDWLIWGDVEKAQIIEAEHTFRKLVTRVGTARAEAMISEMEIEFS